jgi:hypothetical protein
VFPVKYELNLYVMQKKLAEMYCVSCEVRTEFVCVMQKKVDHRCGLVGRVPGYRTQMHGVCCEVRTEFICYAEEISGDVLCFL